MNNVLVEMDKMAQNLELWILITFVVDIHDDPLYYATPVFDIIWKVYLIFFFKKHKCRSAQIKTS